MRGHYESKEEEEEEEERGRDERERQETRVGIYKEVSFGKRDRE